MHILNRYFLLCKFGLFQKMIIMIVITRRMESVVLKFHSKILSMITTQKLLCKRIRLSVKVRQDKEYYFGSKAPYSYVKDEQNHHSLLVDDRLRNIIEKYHSGESILSIFKDFNHRGVVTPAKHIWLKR